MLVKNWQKAYKSWAVLFPTVAMLAGTLLNLAVDSGYINGALAAIINTALANDSVGLAVIVFISGFIGRIVRQPKIEVK